MAIYNMQISNSRDVAKKGIKASEHHDYIERNGKYNPDNYDDNNIQFKNAEEHLKYIERKEAFSKKVEYEDLLYREDKNMPEWAKDNSNIFWKSSELYERANGRTYSEFLISLPHELSNEENKALVDKFCEDTFGESFVYSYGIHSKPSSVDGIQNVHVHIMFCERRLDGIERNPEQFFKRYNPKFPERGGAKKDRFWHDHKLFPLIRKSWENILNEKLEEKGIEKVSCESLEFQKLEAKTAGDIYKEEFLDRPPVNCDGKILIKLNKYGIESLTLEEIEEYELFQIAKEMKVNAEEIYRLNLEEKENKKITHEDYLVQVAYDRAKYAYLTEKKSLLTDNFFNFYEALKVAHNNQFLGITCLIDNDDTLDKEKIKKVTDTFYYSIQDLKEENLFNENEYKKEDINVDIALRHDDFFYETKDLEVLGKIEPKIREEINDLIKEKNALIKDYKDYFVNIDREYFKEIISEVVKNHSDDDEVSLLHDKYKELDKVKSDITNNKDSLFGKIVNKLSKEERKIKLEKEIEELKGKVEYKRDVLTERLKVYLNLEKKNPELNEKATIIRSKINKLDEEILIKELIINVRKEEKSRLNSEAIKKLEEGIIKQRREEAKELAEKAEKRKVEEPKLLSDKELFDEYNKIAIEYCTVRNSFVLNHEKIKKYEKIMNDKNKIFEIAEKKHIAPEKVYLGYSETVSKAREEIKETSDILYKCKFEFDKLKEQDKNYIGEAYYKSTLEDCKKEQRFNFAQLDEIKKAGEDTSKIFKEINTMKIAIESLKTLFDKFEKENVIQEKASNKLSVKNKMVSSKFENERELEKEDRKISPLPSKKIKENNNVYQKETKDVFIYVPTNNKKKKKGMFDDYER